jgi:hypothetical protein
MNTGFYIQQTNLECEGKSKISREPVDKKIACTYVSGIDCERTLKSGIKLI